MKWHALYDTRKHGEGNQIVALFLTADEARNAGLNFYDIPANNVQTRELDLQMPWHRTADPNSGTKPLPGRIVTAHARPSIVAPPPAPIVQPAPDQEPSMAGAISGPASMDVNARLAAKVSSKKA